MRSSRGLISLAHKAVSASPSSLSMAPHDASPRIRALFLDCDDCLYQNAWRTEAKITESMQRMAKEFGVSPDQAFSWYTNYGSTLKGLRETGRIDEVEAEQFLQRAHQIDYSDIREDKALASMLARLRQRTWIFTASIREHALRCIQNIGLGDSLKLQGIIDVRVTKLESKRTAIAFEAALDFARQTDDSLLPGECVLCDDSVGNIKRANAMGWRTVLVGDMDRQGERITCDAADFIVSSLHELPRVLPELFTAADAAAPGDATPISATYPQSKKRGRGEMTLPIEAKAQSLPRRSSLEL